MANYHGPVCRFCRREGAKLYLKGERCYSPKCAIERRAVPPGQHGQARRRKTSDYGLQLRAKQKARRTYGLLEKQFRSYFERAAGEPGVTGTNLLRHLELRLDNVVYRLGMGASRKQSRQLVSHRHFEVNGRTVNIPAFQVKLGDVIKIRDQADTAVAVALDASKMRTTPAWLAFNEGDKSGKVLALPERQDMETGVEEHLIVEFYSR
ncbi:MAG TPA: 30S ribosomal protein S4 [Candidatus Nitrosotalea sp.]|nr:30S ribosomal protein S4 [Candidatus Nitrosotalea sp.]